MSDEIDRILGKIHSGYPILFLGSGFSAYARNKQDKNLPTGRALATLLQQELTYPTEYPLDIISREYTEKKGEKALYDLLLDRFTATQIDGSQSSLLSLPWRRLYTTNYDNVVDLASPRGAFTPSLLADKPAAIRTPAQCVYLNGRLISTNFKTFLSDIKLTRASYLTNFIAQTPWHAAFRRDLALATAFVFVGYSMYDIDVARLVYEDPTVKSKTFFVDTVDIDPVLKRELEQFGSVVPGAIGEFAAASIRTPPPIHTHVHFTSLTQRSLPTSAHEITGDDVLDLIIKGDFKPDAYVQSGPSTAGYAVTRSQVRTSVKAINDGKKRFVIHGDLGNGKTIFVEQLILALLQNDYKVFEVRYGIGNTEADLVALSKEDSSRIVVIVDELLRSYDIPGKISHLIPDAVVIAAVRSSLYDLRSEQIFEIMGEFIEIDVNKLDGDEVNQLIRIADENGLWGSSSHLSEEQKRKYVVATCAGEIRSYVANLLKSPWLEKKIRDTFYGDVNDEIRKCIIIVLLLDVANMSPDISIITYLSEVDIIREAKLKRDVVSKEYIDFSSSRIRVKSSVLAEYLLTEIVESGLTLGCMTRAIQAAERGRAGDERLWEIEKEFMKFSFVDRVFPRTKDSKRYVQFYDQLKTLASMSRNPQFWLQYAIARLEHDDVPGAQLMFDTSYSFAKDRANYNTFQIDNHYARFLIVSRSRDLRFDDYFKAFVEAHKILVRQVHSEPDAYYPYKVARLYRDYVEANGARLSLEQAEIVKGAARQMLGFIEKGTRHLTRYRLVTEARESLEYTVHLVDRLVRKST